MENTCDSYAEILDYWYTVGEGSHIDNEPAIVLDDDSE